MCRVINVWYSIGIVDEKIRQDSQLTAKFESYPRVPRTRNAAASAGAALTGDKRNHRFITFTIRLHWTINFARQGCARRALDDHMERAECRRLPWQRLVVGNAVDQWSGAAQHSRTRCASVYDLVRRPLWNSNNQQNPDRGVSDTNTYPDADTCAGTGTATNSDADSSTCAGTRTASSSDTNADADSSPCAGTCTTANSDTDASTGPCAGTGSCARSGTGTDTNTNTVAFAGTRTHTAERREHARSFQCAVR
jgi:hypothetical protein